MLLWFIAPLLYCQGALVCLLLCLGWGWSGVMRRREWQKHRKSRMVSNPHPHLAHPTAWPGLQPPLCCRAQQEVACSRVRVSPPLPPCLASPWSCRSRAAIGTATATGCHTCKSSTVSTSISSISIVSLTPPRTQPVRPPPHTHPPTHPADGPLECIFVLESLHDPAYQPLLDLRSSQSSRPDPGSRRPIHVLVAGLSQACSQKAHKWVMGKAVGECMCG